MYVSINNNNKFFQAFHLLKRKIIEKNSRKNLITMKIKTKIEKTFFIFKKKNIYIYIYIFYINLCFLR